MADPLAGSEDPTIYMLSTIDNPFNPFEKFQEWMAWDAAHGYHTPSWLAKTIVTSDELSDADQHDAMNMAIEELVRENYIGVWVKVSRDSFPSN